MGMLFQIALNNALAAALLGPLAWCISRARRPELTAAVWLLVLLKLITPPIWTLHIPLHTPARAAAHVASSAPISVQQNVATPEAIPLLNPEPVVQGDSAKATTTSVPTSVSPSSDSRTTWVNHVWEVIAFGWIAGSVVCLLKLMVALARLRHLASASQPAGVDQLLRIRQLALRFGLRRAPPLRLVDLPIPPMLCAVGFQPHVILPTSLWRQISADQQDAVLAHELAHLARRDHWLRAFELLVCSLYWWHPVVWWARRELREATEQCCDALALRTIPHCSGSYAGALLEAIDFISISQTAEPALACGMGQFTNLQRRLVMITQHSTRHALSRPMLAALVAAAAFVLPLSATFAQKIEKPDPSLDQPRGADVTIGLPGSTAQEAPTSNSEGVKVYRLRHVSAERAARVLEIVFAKPGAENQRAEAKAAVATDARTNSVLVTGTPAALEMATKLMNVLDDTAAAGDRIDQVVRDPSVPGQPAPANATSERAPRAPGRRSLDRATMEERLQLLEAQASQILDQIREMKQEMGASPAPSSSRR